MLTKCPECELQVSSKAINCPHCGYPLIKKPKKVPNKKPSHMRLPNGFGQIAKITSKPLRRPFRAMVTVSKTEFGKPVCKILGYYETYNDAYGALVEYNKAPYELGSDLTLMDLYDKWTERYFDTLKSDSSKRTIESAWNYCKPLWYMSVQNIKTYQIKSLILEADVSANMKNRIKSVFNLMFDFAVEFELVDRNPARAFTLSKTIEIEDKESNIHTAFTEEELAKMWQSTDRYTRIALIQCYSGWRPQELGNIRIKDVDLVTWRFTGGMKTSAGKNRTVPIHPAIREFVKSEYNYSISKNCEFLFCCDDGVSHRNNHQLTYDKYRHRFIKLFPSHKAHDPRKTFVTLAKKYNVDEYAIKYIVGHAIQDITESTYTEREKDWLTKEIQKIKTPDLSQEPLSMV